MKEMIHFSAHQAKAASTLSRILELVRNKTTRAINVVCSDSKHLRTNAVLLSLWLIFPLFLFLTSDWIGLLVIFQAMTAAVRMRNSAAAETLAACSSSGVSLNRGKGDYRAL